ncbi:uncharacterized protein JCM10292_002636 [Rhodotorula paludigena]|uniref:uncharacterized protein n=1 Tax=Rhodotorula paludigena TaxID=86838 RepID=UPI00316E96B2
MDMAGMDMTPSFDGVDACFLGNHNGSFPNGTLGAGTWAFGHYVPTSAEMMACQAGNNPWDGSQKYALWTTYFMVVFFGTAGLVNGLRQMDILARNAAIASSYVLPNRIQAALRALDEPRSSRWIPSFGVVLVSLAFTLFSFAVCFGIRPYYRPPNFGSSPLGLRAEFIATALIVWIFATAMKRNALSYLSGLSFHRLMSLHKILPWFCLFFSAVHTGAMILRAHQQEPWSFTYSTNAQYGWSAWAALVALLWLCLLSLAPVRRLGHEFFYTMHVLAALVFVAACYDHFEALLDSWKYLHATLAIMGAAFFYRVGAVAWFSRCFSRPETARVEALDDGALAITIDLKSGMTWTAGQHVFLRFLTLHPWSTHPFTIASLDSSLVPGSSASRTMRFVLRPHSGLTARLLSRTYASPSRSISLPVLLDGPYGASPAHILQGADEAFFVAGGTGISFVLPLLSALVHAAELHIVKRATLVWAVPRAECVEWVRDELEQIVRAKQELDAENEKVDGGEKGIVALTSTLRRVKLEVYVTRGNMTGDDKLKVESNASGASGSLRGIDGVDIHQGRPDVASLVQQSIAQAKGRLAVVTCGPHSLLLEARNTVARAQRAIVMGSLGQNGKGAEEIVLWEESFEL